MILYSIASHNSSHHHILVVMATSTKPTHSAQPAALLVTLVIVALLASGTCTAAAVPPTPPSTAAAVIEAPPVSLVNLTITNLLKTAINYTLSSNVGGVVQFFTSAIIQPQETKQLPVNVVSAAGPVAQPSAKIIVGKLVYTVPVGMTQLIFAQLGTMQAKVSFPCPDRQPGLLVTPVSSSLSDLGEAGICTGPPTTE